MMIEDDYDDNNDDDDDDHDHDHDDDDDYDDDDNDDDDDDLLEDSQIISWLMCTTDIQVKNNLYSLLKINLGNLRKEQNYTLNPKNEL